VLENLGNLGDFLGGIGVVITVVYLAVQIRQSIASTRSSSYQAVVAAISDWSRTIGADENVSRIVRIGSDDIDQLTRDELTQFEMLVVSVTRNFENIHYQYLIGGIPDNAWAGWSSRIVNFFEQPGLKVWWDYHKHACTPEFGTFVENGKGTIENRTVLLSN